MRRLLILLPMLLVFANLSARADEQLDVTWRQARVIRLAKPATSVIVGDPTVADVTLDDPTTLVVFGKAPGETNIVVISSQEMLFDYPLVVSPTSAGHVSVLDASAAPKEILYSCAQQRCTRVLSPSDISFAASSNSTTNSSSDNSKSASTSGEPNIPGSTVIVVPPQGAAPAPAPADTSQ
jgi:Flp pilus assembly secretin CpaC